MSAGIRFIMVAAVAASLMLPVAALAFNPQPDPPGKRQKQDQSLGGLDTKAGWERVHEAGHYGR